MARARKKKIEVGVLQVLQMIIEQLQMGG